MHQEDVNVFFRSGNMSRDKEMVEVVKKEENSRRLDDASRLLLHHVVMFQILVFAVFQFKFKLSLPSVHLFAALP